MDRIAVLSLALVLLTALPAVIGQQVTASERVIEVLENGLLRISDVINVSSPGALVEVGFTEDMRPKLVGYYIEGAEALIELTPVEGNTFSIIARPDGQWPGPSMKLVTVWRDTLLKVGDQYELFIAANPLMRETAGSLSLTVRVPDDAEIKSVQGVSLQIVNKTLASGVLEMRGGRLFESMRVVLNAPDLIFLSYERVEVMVEDPGNPRAELVVKVRNLGEEPVTEIPVQLTSSAAVESVTSGFERLGSFREGDIIIVRLQGRLYSGEAIEFSIRYRDQALLKAEGGVLRVQPPKIYDAQIGEYLVTVITPPATSVTFNKLDPWKIRPVGSMSTSATFRLENFFPTPGFQITLTYQPASFINPLPPLLLALIISGAAAVTIPRIRRPTALKPLIQTELRENLAKLSSMWFEAALDTGKTVEALDPSSGRRLAGMHLDETIKMVRRVGQAAAEISHKQGNIPKDVASKIEAFGRGVGELLDTLQALAKSAEDYQGKKLTRRVYERMYREYIKLVRDLVGELNSSVDELRRLS